MKIYLCRHGETVFSAVEIMQGQKDSLLTENGVSQAKKLGIFFRKEAIGRIYCSPLQRAVSTAEIISKKTGLPFEVDERLKEICCGTLEGQPKRGNPVFLETKRQKKENWAGFRFPKGESYAEFEERLRPFAEQVLKGGKENVLVVAHKGVNRFLLKILLNLEPNDCSKIYLPNFIVYMVEGKKAFHSSFEKNEFVPGLVKKKVKPLVVKDIKKLVLGENPGRNYLLRVGVHSACNHKCIYCNQNGCFNDKSILSDQEFIDLLKAASQLGFRKVHLTGGEPLLRTSLSEILEKARADQPLEYYLTTNGNLLAKNAERLWENNVKRVNISVDSLKPEMQNRITHAKTLKQVLEGIDASVGLFDSVKINLVVLRNYNFSEVPDFVEFCRQKNVILRLMELLPFSISEQPPEFFDENFVSKKELEQALQEIGAIKPAEGIYGNNWACDYWKIGGNRVPVGIVHHHTRGYFCVEDKCNSIRVNAGGTIAACYTQGFPTDSLAGFNFEGKLEKLKECIQIKEALKARTIDYPPYHLPDYKHFRANICKPKAIVTT